MIVAIVASLSIVPAADGLKNLRNREYLTRAEVQLDLIISTAEMVAIEGPGSVRTIDLDFASDGSVKFERVTIGDAENGPNTSSVALVFSTGSRMTKTACDPPIWMKASDDRGLTIVASVFTLKMSANLEGWVEYVLVEMA
jgi:hypothetical protein